MNAKHTPGPWHVGMRSGHNASNVYAYNGKDAFYDDGICQVYGIWQNSTVDAAKNCEGMANAALIAAAPDLLAALEAICSDHDFCGDEWGNRRNAWIETARAAIAKATGGQS